MMNETNPLLMKAGRPKRAMARLEAKTMDRETSEKLDQLADSLAEGNRSRMVRQLIREKWALVELDRLICDCLHHWDFKGDCRENNERYGDTQDYRERNNLTVNDWDIEVRSWEERTEADR